jgi:transposase InsO family protein
MPWKEVSAMSSRREFVVMAQKEGANVRELCRRFSISPTTGYKWLERAAEDAAETFVDRSRRPLSSPRRTAAVMEEYVVGLRDKHPKWNARKIRGVAIRERRSAEGIPAASTVEAILKRHGRLAEPIGGVPTGGWHRFEHEQPNDLVQIDFKGSFLTQRERCFALTMLDDHSRFALALRACANEQTEPVREHLIDVFRLYGLPWRMNMDNGNPWGNPTGNPYTTLTVWLIRLGIAISHSRPLHPQTNGKDERFHRTLKYELLGERVFLDLADVQSAFDQWREIYNHQRPHEGIGLQVPADRYRLSPRPYPETLPSIEYGPNDLLVKLRPNGELYFRKRFFYVNRAFVGQPLALRPTLIDGVWDLFFSHKQITQIDAR